MNRTFIRIALLLCFAASVAMAQETQAPPAQQPQKPQLESVPKPQEPPRRTAAPPEKRVVEEIIARVNNEIVTLTELRRAREAVVGEVEDDCRTGCTPQEKADRLAEREKHLLRDLIDQQLLVQRCKDAGFNVEPDIVKRLEAIRQQNNLADLEALQRAVEQSGINWEDFKNNIRNQFCTQEVMRNEVGRTVQIDKEEIKAYYEAHKQEFDRPETVCLSEIFVSTVDKPEAEIPALEAKAKNLRLRIVNGEDFYEFAKRYSDGDTAKQMGELGCFKREELNKEIWDAASKMKRGDITDVIRTKTGFLFLKVEQRYEAGIQPLEKVEPEIQNRLYYQKSQPKLREYLTKLRGESFVVVKAGYTDTAAVDSTPIVEKEAKSAKDDDGDKKKKRKKFLGII